MSITSAQRSQIVTEYQRAVTIMMGLTEKNQPMFKPYYTNLAMAQTKAKMYDEAIKNYTTAVKIDAKDSILPQNYRVYYYRSFPHFLKNDFGPATDDLDKALSMNDKDNDVVKSAMAAIAKIKDKESIPTLLKRAGDNSTRFEAMTALAEMPDPRSARIYLAGLTEKSPQLRKASSAALRSAAPWVALSYASLPGEPGGRLRKKESQLAPCFFSSLSR